MQTVALMPSAAAILNSLALSANDFAPLAIAWHLALLSLLGAVLVPALRPSQRLWALLSSLPALSVSAVGFAVHNVFNGALFAALFLLLVRASLALPAQRLEWAAPSARTLGLVGLVYALSYPHFVQVSSPIRYLIEAPMGVIPCPTLSMMISLALLGDGLCTTRWSRALSLAGLFYAIVGTLVLQVWLDVGLLGLSLALLGAKLRSHGDRDRGERERIDAFLGLSRIALVGASSAPQDFSRSVMRALLAQGIDVVPVHPSAADIEGRPTFRHVGDIAPPVAGALLMTPPSASAEVVEACARAGIRHVWLHRGAGTGAVSDAALEAAHRHGLSLVAGRCPLMFLGEVKGAHRVHGTLLKWTGRYPLGQRASGRP